MTPAAAAHFVEKTPLQLTGAEKRVLDVACGPAQVSDVAAQRGAGKVVGLDFSSAMLAAARPVADRHGGRVVLVEGDAAALPFDDETFDAVVIGFGLLHLPHPQLALAEAFRVLARGGKVSFSVWETPAPRTAFRMVLDAVAKHGNPHVQLPGVDGEAPLPFFHFADLATSRAALVAAGFDATSVARQVVPAHAALSHADELYQMFATATARTRATFELQSAEELRAIKAEMAKSVSHCRGTMTSDGSHRTTSWHRGPNEIPGTEETTLKLTSADATVIGGRTCFTIPMPAVVIAATKP